MKNLKLCLILISFFVSCSRGCIEDFQLDAKKDIKKIVKVLSSIQTKEELIKEGPRLKKIMNHLVDLMIEAKEFDSSDPQLIHSDYSSSNELKEALEHLYKIEGARPLFEEIQRDSLHRLDLFAKKYESIY